MKLKKDEFETLRQIDVGSINSQRKMAENNKKESGGHQTGATQLAEKTFRYLARIVFCVSAVCGLERSALEARTMASDR